MTKVEGEPQNIEQEILNVEVVRPGFAPVGRLSEPAHRSRNNKPLLITTNVLLWCGRSWVRRVGDPAYSAPDFSL